MEREVRRIVCQDDSSNTYTVIEYQQVIEARLLSGEVERMDGLKRLVVSGGGNVNFIDEDTFQIVSNGKIIRKI